MSTRIQDAASLGVVQNGDVVPVYRAGNNNPTTVVFGSIKLFFFYNADMIRHIMYVPSTGVFPLRDASGTNVGINTTNYLPFIDSSGTPKNINMIV